MEEQASVALKRQGCNGNPQMNDDYTSPAPITMASEALAPVKERPSELPAEPEARTPPTVSVAETQLAVAATTGDASQTTKPSAADAEEVQPLANGSEVAACSTTSAQTLADALRVSVMQRAQHDRQSRDERVDPIIKENRKNCEVRSPTQKAERKSLVHEIMKTWRDRNAEGGLAATKAGLEDRFEKRHTRQIEKARTLRERYLELHESWTARCSRLDDRDPIRVSTPVAQEEVMLPTGGRTTRRTTATLGDAVRSDLEMQQIIESLGNEDMTDPNHLAARNVATIPDMISVAHGDVEYVYDDTNNLVNNPIEFYKHRTGFLDWTNDEKAIFNAKFAAHPKQFGIIADALKHKTAAQCVVYYYLHKKTFVDFRKVVTDYAPGKRRRGGRKVDKQKGNALLTDIRRHDDEVSSGRATRTRKPRLPIPDNTPTPTPEPELDPKPRKRRAARITAQEVEMVDEVSRPIGCFIGLFGDLRYPRTVLSNLPKKGSGVENRRLSLPLLETRHHRPRRSIGSLTRLTMQMAVVSHLRVRLGQKKTKVRYQFSHTHWHF